MNAAFRHVALFAVLVLAACPGDDGNGPVVPPAPSVPLAPSHLVTEFVNSSRIDLRWVDNATNEDGLRIERCAGANCSNFTHLMTLPANFTATVDVGLTASTVYRYRVQAFNSAGGSGFAGPVTATTLAAMTPPAPPTAFSATFVSLSRVDLAWADNATNEDAYELERCSGAGCTNFVKFAATLANATSYTMTAPLAASTSYTYRVYAVNGAGPSASVTATIVTPPGAPTTPAPPANLQATAASASQINLSWSDASTNEDGFRIERCTGTTCTNYAFVANAAANATSFSNTGLAAATTYRYRIQSYNAGGSSTAVGPASATTAAQVTLPAPPSALVAEAGSSSQINLSWTDASTNEAGFKVERCSAASCTFTEIGSVAAGVTTYQNTGLASSTAYTYRVRSYNSAGSSAPSPTATATTFAPLATPLLNTPAVSGTSITLTWSFTWPGGLASSADRYELEVSTTSSTSGFGLVNSYYEHTSPKTVTLSNRAPGTHWFRVRAFTTQGVSNYSAVRSATVSATTAQITLVNQLSGVGSSVLRFRVAATQAQLYAASNTSAERLSPDSYCGSLPGESVDAGESSVFDVTANAPNYRVYVGLGRWDNSDGNGGATCWHKKNWAADANFSLLYIYNEIVVSNHSGNMTWTLTYDANDNIILRVGTTVIPFVVSIDQDPIR